MKSYVNEDKSVRLYNGDCLEVMDKMIERGVKVDLILTDPPYGTTACKWDSVIPFDGMWERLKLLRNNTTPIILFGSEPFSSMLRISNLKDYRYDWVWEKSKSTGFLNSKKQPLRAFENILCFYQKQCLYMPQMKNGESYNKGLRKKQTSDDVYGKFNVVEVKNETGLRYPRNVLYFKTAEREGCFHKTQKPIALMEYLIKTYTNEGDTVLDFTMGSGTTGVACMNLNRKFIGIEFNPEKHKDGNFVHVDKYFDIAVERIKTSKIKANTDFGKPNHKI